MSLAQFRPEKDHPLQIRSFAKVRDKIYEENVSDAEKDAKWEKVKLKQETFLDTKHYRARATFVNER